MTEPLQTTNATVGERRPLRALSRLAVTQAVVRQRVLTAIPDPTFDSAASVILGQDLDLRGKSAQPWLSKVGPGEGDIDYSAFGTSFFTAKRNQQARDDWHTQANAFESIAQEVYRGRFGLIDSGRLHDAATAVDDRVRLLSDAIDQMNGWTSAANGNGSAGNAAAALSGRLVEYVEGFTRMRDQLTTPAPPVATTLHEAADALDEFARGMAGAWFESHTALLNSPDEAVGAIVGNIQNYLRQNGLLSDSPAYQQHASDPAAAAGWVRGVLAAYSSDAGGGLLPGMDPISGDLTSQALWDAANTSITKRITTELDRLDAAAKGLVQKLDPKYQAVTDRLKNVPQMAMRMRARILAKKAVPAG